MEKASPTASGNFRRRFMSLVVLAWTVPPVFGLGFLLFIEMFSPAQMLTILTTPLEPVFIVTTLLVALVYFDHLAQPVVQALAGDIDSGHELVRGWLQRFPLHFWGMFLGYLLLAPASVIVAAELYTDYRAVPLDWFRIHLVALIVSIIVGLPIFFALYDLFGRSFGQLRLSRPALTIRTRVFLIGALVPLLMDTMLVQYYWSRTGFFSGETFAMWLMLELLAIAGALLFLRSFGQSLAPLRRLLSGTHGQALDPQPLVAASTDELGLLTTELDALLDQLQTQHQRLDFGNQLLRRSHDLQGLEELHRLIIDKTVESLHGQLCILALADRSDKTLRVVVYTGVEYRAEGHYCIPLDEPTLFSEVYTRGRSQLLNGIPPEHCPQPGMARERGVHSIMAAPLVAGERSYGVLALARTGEDANFDEGELQALEGFAQEAALARVLMDDLCERQRIEKAISTITEAVSTQSGESFFSALNQHLATMLQACSVGTGVLCDNGQEIETLAFYMDGRIIPNVRYQLANTPCEKVVGDRIRIYPDKVQARFPDDGALRELGIEAYVGVPLFDSEKQALGLQFALFSEPLENTGFVESVMRIFAARVSVEIERLRAEERIRHLAYYDGLTRLPNRELLLDRLRQSIAHAGRSGTSVALMMLDLDHFKSVNDSLGHPVGDHLLAETGRRLLECIRSEDTVARLGGDEFVILLHDLGDHGAVQHATRVATKIRERLSEPLQMDGHELVVTSSLGIAIFPQDGDTPDQLFKHADTALYKAKSQGRDGYRFFSPAMNTEAVERLQMETCLRQALEEDQFELVFQPKVAIEDGRILGAEALLRWHHPVLGQVSPEVFIPVAEETGLIIPVGKRVLELACRATSEFWCRHSGCSHGQRLSINVSPRQFQQPDFVRQLQDVLAANCTRPVCIEVEITEGVLVQGLDKVRAKLQQLQDLGITVAIDDFGTGYSSLSYLKQLPLDRLKIDRSFVRDLPGDGDDAAITQAILAMARHLRLETIAEGVETTEQLQFLARHGCHAYQGYYFSRPVAAGEFVELLRSNDSRVVAVTDRCEPHEH